jgi:rhodanese-related sulfurtransferase
MLRANFRNRTNNRFLLLLADLLVIFIITGTITANENKDNLSEAASVKPQTHHSHCGLYCLYAAMKLSGREIDFTQLVKPEYIGSRKGSSMVELKNAAEDSGMYAVPIGKLTNRVLHNCPYPVILHVKSDVTSKEYDHYELFLGIENHKAKLFNPPEPVRLVPFRELAPRWDGNGLIISAKPIDHGSIFAPVRRRFAVYAAIAIAAILTVHYARRWLPQALLNTRRKLLGLSVAQSAALGIVALSFGMVYHFANDEGFLAHANATASIQEAHQGNFIPKVGEKKVHKLLDTDTVFIDARLARDFKAGHLEGAINIPVNTNDDGREKIMANIAKDAQIVVYCQSAGCKFAEKVAIKLMEDGFHNVSIFKGGWREWAAKSSK